MTNETSGGVRRTIPELLGGVLRKAANGRRATPMLRQRIDRLRPHLQAYEVLCDEIGENARRRGARMAAPQIGGYGGDQWPPHRRAVGPNLKAPSVMLSNETWRGWMRSGPARAARRRWPMPGGARGAETAVLRRTALLADALAAGLGSAAPWSGSARRSRRSRCWASATNVGATQDHGRLVTQASSGRDVHEGVVERGAPAHVGEGLARDGVRVAPSLAPRRPAAPRTSSSGSDALAAR
jgi:hypothetical protein